MLDKETREALDRLTAPATKTRQNPVDFYKCRDVNDPTRAWSAAGIDFYMPRFRDSKEQTEPSARRDGWQEAKDTPFR